MGTHVHDGHAALDRLTLPRDGSDAELSGLLLQDMECGNTPAAMSTSHLLERPAILPCGHDCLADVHSPPVSCVVGGQCSADLCQPPLELLSITSLDVVEAPLPAGHFAVFSFGMSTFRTSVFRDGRSPLPEGNLLAFLLVRSYETQYPLKISLYRHRRLASSNELIGEGYVDVALLRRDDRQQFSIPCIMSPTGSSEATFTLTIAGRLLSWRAIQESFFAHADAALGGQCLEDVPLDRLATLLDQWTMHVCSAFENLETAGPLAKRYLLVHSLTYTLLHAPSQRVLGLLSGDAPANGTGTSTLSLSSGGSCHSDSLPDDPAAAYPVAASTEYLAELDRALGEAGADMVLSLPEEMTHAYSENPFIVGAFFSEAQARRGRIARILRRPHRAGDLKSSISVVDRATGLAMVETIPSAVRLSIRALYNQNQLLRRSLESATIRNLFLRLSIRQGRKYNDPRSAQYIAGFVDFHQINMEDFEAPAPGRPDQHYGYQTFNEFFFRPLRPGARPMASPGDERICLVPADCRLTLFRTVNDATRLWIKGRNFSLEALLRLDLAPGGLSLDASRFHHGALALCRLAPQDYHRFHSPVAGRVVACIDVPGALYSVNPMAIRGTEIDVLTDNKRVVLVIDSPEFGLVAYVIVGAMMVGSIVFTGPHRVGEEIRRFDEIGYFAFGGSTVVCLFEPGRFTPDSDLERNSQRPIETLVRVGTSMGTAAAGLR
ncbi:hypothetical protein H696_00930 [Fonticula alba]|uniref:phosphatidylserine decarboxylase n=1 Tax=Fonticula alba TaxID=691883 RepID=A0A058ZIP7_FONAL|nr:hypothetical protein H696_00930 [Fonticula alba]KCV73392.1 hypothetical protein H696_00930 [Fonticula alba]|eukprot:XP_009493093.1 hypothetical protein H696_00930 [Fonticula alba]